MRVERQAKFPSARTASPGQALIASSPARRPQETPRDRPRPEEVTEPRATPSGAIPDGPGAFVRLLDAATDVMRLGRLPASPPGARASRRARCGGPGNTWAFFWTLACHRSSAGSAHAGSSSASTSSATSSNRRRSSGGTIGARKNQESSRETRLQRDPARKRRIRGLQPPLGRRGDGTIRMSGEPLDRRAVTFGGLVPASGQQHRHERRGFRRSAPFGLSRPRVSSEEPLQHGQASSRFARIPARFLVFEPRRSQRLLKVVTVGTRQSERRHLLSRRLAGGDQHAMSLAHRLRNHLRLDRERRVRMRSSPASAEAATSRHASLLSTINARAANQSARDGSRLYAATKSIASAGDLASITIAPGGPSSQSPSFLTCSSREARNTSGFRLGSVIAWRFAQ